MGEIAEMMLDGTMCEGCGEFLGGDAPGFPRYCQACGGNTVYSRHGTQVAKSTARSKRDTKCPDCGKRYRGVKGVAEHRQKVHGPTLAAQFVGSIDLSPALEAGVGLEALVGALEGAACALEIVANYVAEHTPHHAASFGIRSDAQKARVLISHFRKDQDNG